MKTKREAFTLVELLIVMAIIVLAMFITVPAIRALSGSRSEQAAQNTVAAFLSTARSEAVGLQETHGIVFYIDPGTDRVFAAQVYGTPLYPGDPAGPEYLDLVADHDPLALPSGIRVRVLKSVTDPKIPGDFYPTDRYLGFDLVGPGGTRNNPGGTAQPSNSGGTPFLVGGVILFDATGRVTSKPYLFRTIEPDPETPPVSPGSPIFKGTRQTRMGGLLGISLGAGKTTVYQSVNNPGSQFIRSAVGFVLFDRETFLNQGFSDSNGQANDAAAEATLDQSATPVLVNRYTGTLTRAE